MAMFTKLMPHQHQVIDFMLDNKKPYYGIFLPYGVGKTVTMLAFLNIVRFQKVLVISSKTAVTSTWVDEIRQHTDFGYTFLLGTRNQRLINLSMGLRRVYRQSKKMPFLFLINFDGVHSIFLELMKTKFDMIIVDESVKIKCIKTARTKAIIKLGGYTKHRAILTGFPITENLTDIYSQIKFLDQGESFGQSYYAFLDKYFVKTGMDIVPKKKGAEEIIRLIKSFCIRLEVKGMKLPPKIMKMIHIDATKQQSRLLKSLYDLMKVEFGRVKIDTVYIFSLIAKALQICSGFLKESDIFDEEGNLIKKGTIIETFPTAKDEALFDVLEEIDLNKNKVIIWCSFRQSVRKLYRLLKGVGYPPLLLTGSTQDVNTVVRQFQHDKTKRVLIAIQKKASESITLTSANHAIYYENSWSNDLRMNSEARIHRKGSEIHKSIFYTDLIIKDSIEDKIVKCLHDKGEMVSNLKEEFLKTHRG